MVWVIWALLVFCQKEVVLKSAGGGLRAAAAGPLPLPSVPWHMAQWLLKIPWPDWAYAGAGGHNSPDPRSSMVIDQRINVFMDASPSDRIFTNTIFVAVLSERSG